MKYALIVGINKYKNPGSNLRGCVNDARDMWRILQYRGFKEVVCLYDQSATKENIQTNLKKLIGKLKPRDSLVYYHSGHGVQLKDTNNNEVDGLDEVLVCHDFDFDDTHQFTDDVLRDCLKNQPKNTKVSLIFDTCFSGGFYTDTIGKTKSLQTKNKASGDIKKFGIHQRGIQHQRHILFSGSKEHQYSFETKIRNATRGLMTETFTRNLRKSRKLTWNQLITKVSTEISLNTNKQQIPQLVGPAWFLKMKALS